VQAMNHVVAEAISSAVTAALGPLVPEDFNEGCLMYYSYAKIVIGFGNTRELLGESVHGEGTKIGPATGVVSSEMGSVSRGCDLLVREQRPVQSTWSPSSASCAPFQ